MLVIQYPMQNMTCLQGEVAAAADRPRVRVRAPRVGPPRGRRLLGGRGVRGRARARAHGPRAHRARARLLQRLCHPGRAWPPGPLGRCQGSVLKCKHAVSMLHARIKGQLAVDENLDIWMWAKSAQ